MLRRVVAGISGNALVQAVNLIVQVIGVPLFLTYWGVNYYGEWLILFTIPGYIAISDLGIGTAATTEMAMMLERKEVQKINILLRNSFWFVVVFGSIPFILLISSIAVLPWYDWLRLEEMSKSEFNASFILLILYVYVSIFMSLPLNYYRVEKRYHQERFISTIFKLLEFGSVAGCLILGYGAVAAATSFLVWRVLMLAFMIFDLQNKSAIFRLLPFTLDVREVQGVFKPGFSLMGFFLGQNLLNQGIVTIIGISLGSGVVVVFTTVRTLINMVKQIIGTINQVLFSEFSFAKGKGKIEMLYQLFMGSLLVNMMVSICSCLILIFFGERIIQIWTNGAISVDRVFFALMVFYIFWAALSNLSFTFVGAINQFKRLSLVFLVMTVLLLFLSTYSTYLGGLRFVALLLLLFEVILFISGTNICLGILNKNWASLFHFSKLNLQTMGLKQRVP